MTQHRPLRLTDVGRRDLAFVRGMADRMILRGEYLDRAKALGVAKSDRAALQRAEQLDLEEQAEAWARIRACRHRWFADPTALS